MLQVGETSADSEESTEHADAQAVPIRAGASLSGLSTSADTRAASADEHSCHLLRLHLVYSEPAGRLDDALSATASCRRQQ